MSIRVANDSERVLNLITIFYSERGQAGTRYVHARDRQSVRVTTKRAIESIDRYARTP